MLFLAISRHYAGNRLCCGTEFSQMIQNWDHWIAFALLTIIGVNMIREGLSSDDEPTPLID